MPYDSGGGYSGYYADLDLPRDGDAGTAPLPKASYGLVENRDYVWFDNERHDYSESAIHSYMREIRSMVTDLEDMPVYPIFDEARMDPMASTKTATELEAERGPYNLASPLDEDRFVTPFDSLGAYLIAYQSWFGKAHSLKNRINESFNDIDMDYRIIFDKELTEHGKAMGTNNDAKKAWMRSKYPALVGWRDCLMMLNKELGTEIDQHVRNYEILSRTLSAYQTAWQVTGRITSMSLRM